MSRFLSPGTLTILILAILFGLAAAYAIRNVLGPRVPELPPEAPISNVPLAGADLPSGRTIVMDDLALVPMTREQMEQQPWGKLLRSVMLSPEQIIGRTLQRQLPQGSPIMTSDLYLQGLGPSLLELLKPGYRAISIQVPFERGGFVTLGANVDVIFRSAYRPGNNVTPPIPETTRVLVENAEVIAVERITTPPSGTNTIANLDLRQSNRAASADEPLPTTIVLAVQPQQANRIEAVRNHGEFTLLTRPPDETSFGGPPPPTSLEDVLGLQALLPEEPVLPAITEIYRRGARQVNAFQAQGNRYVPVSGGVP